MHPPAAHPDDELFRPTLTADDDAVGFARPWNPWSLVVLAFFFGLPAGGALLSWNLYRLGVGRRALPAFSLVEVATLALAAIGGWAAVRAPEGTQSWLPSALRAAWTLVAAALATAQRKRFRVFRASVAEEGRLWLPGVAAAACSVVLWELLLILFATVFAP
ncbi:MAG: hypothetical protein K0Q72_3686 [Armatimonadetes bacterium]|jgi:hypothetical protein|nr:hypothetical protein [Armatimonadota bacterium]